MSDFSVEDFRGTYQVRQGTLFDPGSTGLDPRRMVNVFNTISLQPRDGGDPEQLYFELWGPEPGSEPLDGPYPLTFDQENGVMTSHTEDFQGTGKPMTMQISLFLDPKMCYKSVYGIMVFDDPENVGVWGGDAGGQAPGS